MTIQGTVEYVIHRNAQNGYSVIEISDEKGPITIVGILPELQEGEPIEVEGSFVTHPVYGEQFSVERFTLSLPEDAAAIERYLASGAIKGIGPALAARIVRQFESDTLRIMEESPETLAKVKGISLKGARLISAQVIEKREMRQALMFMEKYGIPLSLAVRIYERYGATLYSVIETNPYRLMDDITHVGFRIADDIARSVGLAADSDYRIRSGLQYAMMQALESGHIFLPRAALISYTASLLEQPEELIEKHVMDLAIDKRFILRDLNGVPIVYLSTYYYMEASAAAMLCQLNQSFPLQDDFLSAEIGKLEKESGLELEDKQREAVLTAIRCGLTVITGGPGTGKTTIISAILRYFEKKEMKVELAAPTGRAARRITEATGHPAQTVHRLLEFMGMPDENREDEVLRFTRNESNPISADVVIIDEVSMVDLPLMYALLKALIPCTRLILVGDASQLPSVGPGNVLKDIIRSGVAPTIALSKIFRQAENSDIIVNAHRINKGEVITPNPASRDFLFIQRGDAAVILQAVIRLVKEKLPPYVKAEPWEIQVITPMRKGILGVENLNRVLQQYLNPPAEGRKERQFARCLLRVGDKVMQIKNNYQREWESREQGGLLLRQGTGIFNGDIGFVKDIRFFTEELVIVFDDGREAVYPFSDADELDLAYAVTVHKSQGSEYPAIVLPLLNVPQPLMTRPLIYTAVTRARNCVCVVGSLTTFQQMVDNNTEQQRFSTLHLQLIELAR
ncbi:MAG: ATP-dependent RecD-like DNA helicase [Lachnospiraceae bacterium]|nr:ATP-dependent RecD-like DNA helicase [Lachnospiraceae bacterium]